MLGELVDLLQQASRHVRVHGEVVDLLLLGGGDRVDGEVLDLLLLLEGGVRVDGEVLDLLLLR